MSGCPQGPARGGLVLESLWNHGPRCLEWPLDALCVPSPLEPCLPCSSPGKEGRAWLPLPASGLVWLFVLLCVPADSRSSPLPVGATADLLWRFLKQ